MCTHARNGCLLTILYPYHSDQTTSHKTKLHLPKWEDNHSCYDPNQHENEKADFTNPVISNILSYFGSLKWKEQETAKLKSIMVVTILSVLSSSIVMFEVGWLMNPLKDFLTFNSFTTSEFTINRPMGGNYHCAETHHVLGTLIYLSVRM